MTAGKTATTTLAEDLVAALGALHDVAKARTAKAGSYTYSYAGLSDVLASVRPVLAEHRLALTQSVTSDDSGRLVITTTLLHASGDRHDAGALAWPMPDNPQAAGSLISYGRRYALLAVLGIAGADDDDDAVVVTRTPPAAKTKPKASTKPTTDSTVATEAQLRAIHASLANAGITDRDDRLAFVVGAVGRTVATSKDLTREEAGRVIERSNELANGELHIEVGDDGTWKLTPAGST